MKIRVTIGLLLFICTAFFFIAAGKKENGPYKPTYIKLEIPKGWPQPSTNIFANNPLTEEGFHWAEDCFMMAALARMAILPAPPATNSLQHLLLTTMILATALIIHLPHVMHRAFLI